MTVLIGKEDTELDRDVVLGIECRLLDRIEDGLGSRWRELNTSEYTDATSVGVEEVLSKLEGRMDEQNVRNTYDFIESNSSLYVCPMEEECGCFQEIIRSLGDPTLEDIARAYGIQDTDGDEVG